MLTIPLPFVTALLIALLLGIMLARGAGPKSPAAIFTGACLLLALLVGLRWSLDLRLLRFAQPVVAALLPPLAWLCFAGPQGGRPGARRWPHLLPVALVLALSLLWPWWPLPIDAVLALQYFGYGAALSRRAMAGPDAMPASRFSDVAIAGRALRLVGLFLILSGGVDLLVAADFLIGQGGHAARIVAAANLIVLPLIAWAVAVIASSMPPPPDAAPDAAPEAPADTPPEPAAPAPDPEDAAQDAQVLARFDQAMQQMQLYRDPDLTLERLARRLVIPGRQISRAINRRLGMNVSQAVNEYRVREAMRLLEAGDQPVTAIMFDSGFQTKSNFNREFLRIAGTTPRDWRDSRAGAAKAKATLPKTR